MTDVYLLDLNPNDAGAHCVEWLAQQHESVVEGAILGVFETTKSSFEVVAPASGFLVKLVEQGDYVLRESKICEIVPDLGVQNGLPEKTLDHENRVFTKNAKRLLQTMDISSDDVPYFEGVVREADVLRIYGAGPTPSGENENVGSEKHLDGESRDVELLRETLGALRRSKLLAFSRHVPLGTLLGSRDQLAADMGWGNGSSLYDESLVLGSVDVGSNCWIGPFTVLDASGGRLTIGDWTSVGAGSQIYTHHTIDRALSRGRFGKGGGEVSIGAGCFISPGAVILPGSIIGACSLVAAHAVVEGIFPGNSIISGNPATRVGEIKFVDGRPRRSLFPSP